MLGQRRALLPRDPRPLLPRPMYKEDKHRRLLTLPSPVHGRTRLRETASEPVADEVPHQRRVQPLYGVRDTADSESPRSIAAKRGGSGWARHSNLIQWEKLSTSRRS